MTSFVLNKQQYYYSMYSGIGIINTTYYPLAITKNENTPISTNVYLYSHKMEKFVTKIKSDEFGHWSVSGLNPNEFFYAKINDASRTLNGAILEWLKPIIPE